MSCVLRVGINGIIIGKHRHKANDQAYISEYI